MDISLLFVHGPFAIIVHEVSDAFFHRNMYRINQAGNAPLAANQSFIYSERSLFQPNLRPLVDNSCFP